MSAITFLSFRSPHCIMDFLYLTGKSHDSPILLFRSKNIFFYNFLAIIIYIHILSDNVLN